MTRVALVPSVVMETHDDIYEPPTIRPLGSLEDLTQASTEGDQLDADFPDGTPRGDLTFS